MIAKSREVSIGAIAHFSADPKMRDALCEIAVAYPVAFHVHLTGGGGARPKSELRAMLEGILDEATLGLLAAANKYAVPPSSTFLHPKPPTTGVNNIQLSMEKQKI